MAKTLQNPFPVRAAGVVPNLFMIFLGLVLAVPCAWRIIDYALFSFRALALTGVVDKPTGGSDFGGRPLVAYQAGGQDHVMKSPVKTHILKAPRKGEPIALLVSREDPRDAMVKSRFHYIWLPLVFFSLGAAIVIRAVRNLMARPGPGSGHLAG